MSCRVATSVERSEMVWPSKPRSRAVPGSSIASLAGNASVLALGSDKRCGQDRHARSRGQYLVPHHGVVTGMLGRSDQFSKIMPMKAKTSQFDGLVARYYPAVYGLAARLTDDPREAVAVTRAAFSSAQKQLSHVRNRTTIAAVLLTAVLRAGLTSG
jgi:hypothetical protein